jgi:hypothetical protein
MMGHWMVVPPHAVRWPVDDAGFAPTPPGVRSERGAVAAAGVGVGGGGVSLLRATAGRGSSPGAPYAGNSDRDFCVVSEPGAY